MFLFCFVVFCTCVIYRKLNVKPTSSDLLDRVRRDVIKLMTSNVPHALGEGRWGWGVGGGGGVGSGGEGRHAC